jgi:hypothetical protein
VWERPSVRWLLPRIRRARVQNSGCTATPLPERGFSNDGCYMSWTNDCDGQISREHFVSASVLSHLGGQNVSLSGVPWLAVDETKDLPINAMTAKILCKRHNEAFAPLDAMAGKFFAYSGLSIMTPGTRELYRDATDGIYSAAKNLSCGCSKHRLAFFILAPQQKRDLG